MEAKQHATKQPMGQRRNHKGNYKITRGECKQKYNIPKLTYTYKC